MTVIGLLVPKDWVILVLNVVTGMIANWLHEVWYPPATAPLTSYVFFLGRLLKRGGISISGRTNSFRSWVAEIEKGLEELCIQWWTTLSVGVQESSSRLYNWLQQVCRASSSRIRARLGGREGNEELRGVAMDNLPRDTGWSGPAKGNVPVKWTRATEPLGALKPIEVDIADKLEALQSLDGALFEFWVVVLG